MYASNLKNLKTANIPIVIISASDPNQYSTEINELKIIDYVTKPFNSTELQQKLSSYLA